MDFNHKLIKQLTAVTLSASLVGCGGEITQLGGTLFGNDTEAVPAFSQEFMTGKVGYLEGQNAPGFVPDFSNVYTFNEGGSGQRYETQFGQNPSTSELSWSVDESGSVSIDYAGLNTTFIDCYSSLITDNFPQDVVDQVNAACDQSLFIGAQIEAQQAISNELWQLTQSHSSRIRMSVTRTETITLLIPQEVIENVEGGWQVDTQPSVNVVSEPFDTTFGYQPAPDVDAITETDLANDWVMPLQYNLILDGNPVENGTGFFQERFSFDGVSATGKLSGRAFTVSVTESGFALTDGSASFVYTPYEQVENEYTVLVDYQVDGVTQHLYLSNMAQVDGTATQFFDNILTELPQVYNASINATLESQRVNGVPSLENSGLFAYQFRDDGTFRRGIFSVNDQSNPDPDRATPYFANNEVWNYSVDSATDIIATVGNPFVGFVRERDWEIIGVNSSGKVLMLEYSIWNFDNNNDNIVDDRFWAILPRINYFELIDLQTSYPTAWDHTDLDNDGLINSAEEAAGSDFNNPDTDGDGLSDGEEVNTYQTDPLSTDTDGDTFSDFDEVQAGTDPNDSNSTPGPELSALVFPDANLSACVTNTGLSRADQVTNLDCSFSRITDLTGIEQLPNIESFNFANNFIADASPLAQLGSLNSVNLQNNPLTSIADFNSTSVTSLNLSGTLVRDMNNLAPIASLQSIVINDGVLKSIDGIEVLSGLGSVSLNNTQVESLAPLAGLANLSEINSLGNFNVSCSEEANLPSLAPGGFDGECKPNMNRVQVSNETSLYGITDILATDLNNDGNVDLIGTSDGSAAVFALTNNGSGQFTKSFLLSDQPGAVDIGLGNFKSETVLDYLVTSKRLSLFRFDMALVGVDSSYQGIANDINERMVTIGNFDSDSLDEVITMSQNSGPGIIKWDFSATTDRFVPTLLGPSNSSNISAIHVNENTLYFSSTPDGIGSNIFAIDITNPEGGETEVATQTTELVENLYHVGDLDADNIDDFVYASTSNVRVIFSGGNGDVLIGGGVFREERHVIVNDFNNDGELDILHRESSGGISYKVNQGDGTFVSGSGINFVCCDNLVMMTSADVNNDGFDDVIAVIDSYEIHIYQNIGGTSFSLLSEVASDEMYAFSMGNFVGPNNGLDIAAASHTSQELFFFENDGSNNFSKVSTGLGNLGLSLETETVPALNSDLFDSLAYATNVGNVSFIDNGTGTPTAEFIGSGQGGSFTHFIIADADLDSDADIISTGLEIYSNDGNNNFTQQPLFGSAARSESVAVGDFNGDGRIDYFHVDDDFSTSTRQVEILLDDGTGGFSSQIIAQMTASDVPQVVDLDGDGDLDIVGVRNIEPFQNGVLVNDGTGTFSFEPWQNSDSFIDDIRVANIDSDPALELVTFNAFGSDLDFFEISQSSENPIEFSLIPDGAIRINSSDSSSFATSQLELIDIDLDGDIDVVVSEDSRIVVYENQQN